MNEPITVCLTSCGRHDLLRQTLDSFFKHNTYTNIKAFYIYEDAQVNPFPYDGVEWHPCWTHKGQILALDFLWSLVETPYAFFLEDDWLFLRSGFIEKSMKIMDKHDDILQVRLCSLDGMNAHPIDHSRGFGMLKAGNLWAGTNFNPSLRRKADYDLIAPFSRHTIFNPSKAWRSEADISRIYNSLGFRAAILDENYIKHLGEGRHCE